jgi:6-phosphogluconate dehydrogenase
MQLGMVGLGRMGDSMVRRLIAGGHQCVVHDRSERAVEVSVQAGAIGSRSLEELLAQLTTPRVIWVMVPASAVDELLVELAAQLDAGDILIDGGNSHFKADIERARMLSARGIHYLDVGTSGGVHGLKRGYCLMIGGEAAVVERVAPVFRTLAPGFSEPRTPGNDGDPSPAEQGWLHCGPVGAGHFVKMVHNGIEYGLMAAYAEGFEILRHAGVGQHAQGADAETAPLTDPEAYRYDIDIARVSEVWRRGSVIASWLLDLTDGGGFAQRPRAQRFRRPGLGFR